MTKERKLYLVKPGAPQPEDAAPPDASLGLDAPPTLDEERAAEALRDAIERGDEPISSSLRAAWSPEAGSALDHDALLARALGDPEAPIPASEERAAARLRDALDAPAGASLVPSDADLDAELLFSLRLAAKPSSPRERAHEALLDRVLAEPLAPPTHDELAPADALRSALEEGRDVPSLIHALRAARRPRELDRARNEALIARALGRDRWRRRRAISIVAGVLAMAACLALVATQGLKSAVPSAGSAAASTLIPSRSTANLFDSTEAFPRTGGESARIDRILQARAGDLRANQFAAWGVR